jgi:two-component system response regulator AgrA
LLKIILCDSNNDDAKYIERTIRSIAQKNNYSIEIVLIASSPEEVLENLYEKQIYLYIIEVVYDRSEMDGVELAQGIRESDRDSYIVFCTSESHYIYRTLTGLIRPAGFLVKELNDNGKLEKIDGIHILLGDVYRDCLNLTNEKQDVLHINIGAEIYKIEYSDILFIESFQKKIYIHTFNQRIGYYDSLASLENKLGDKFVRCHRSYIINTENVSSVCFPEKKIKMKNDLEIFISRRYKDIIKDKLSLSENIS